MTLLELVDVTAFYGPVQVLEGVSLDVPEGGAVGILGANGAGKTTTLRAISGTVRAGGTIVFDGKRHPRAAAPTRSPPSASPTCPRGEARCGELTVRENLRVGAYLRKDRKAIAADIDYCLDLFPQAARSAIALERRRRSPAASSRCWPSPARSWPGRGCCCWMRHPSGSRRAPPRTSTRRSAGCARSRASPCSIVEQNANLAFTLVDTATVLETGRNVLTGTSAELKGMDEIRRAYLGG